MFRGISTSNYGKMHDYDRPTGKTLEISALVDARDGLRTDANHARRVYQQKLKKTGRNECVA